MKGGIISERQRRRKRRQLTIAMVLVAIIVAIGVFFVGQIRQDNGASGSGTADAQNSAAPTATVDPVQKKVDSLVSSMSLEEKVGQLFLARVPESGQTDAISQYHLGGYLMFERDFQGETPDSLTAKIQSWQNTATTPMFIASDEEGGEVTRVSMVAGLTDGLFQSPQAVYAQGGMDAIASDTAQKSAVLKKYGINYNLAPVADVADDPGSFIYSRTIGLDAAQTSQYIQVVVKAMKEGKVGCSLKHFPGYGDNGDSHGEIIRDSRDLATFQQRDLKPFQAGIDAGADSVLVTHNIISCMDDSEPASLSPAVHNYLRNTMGFKGVILTDDFDMKGLSDFIDQDNGAIKSIQAGNDLTISSSYADQIPTVIQAVQNGTISEDTINASVRRILKMKIDLGIIDVN